MSPETQQPVDTSKRDGIRAVLFLLGLIVVLVVATFLFGASALLVAAIVGSFIMLGILIFLSAPNQKA